MPLGDQKKKPPQRTGPPDHRQEMSLESIDRAHTDLKRVLTAVSGNHAEMRDIIGALQGPVTAAKRWVLDN